MKGIEKRFLRTLGCFSLISISLLFLPLATPNEEVAPIGIAIGVLFWLGLISGSISYFLMNRKYRARLQKEFPKRKLPSCFRFFCSPVIAIIDIVLILSTAMSIYCSTRYDANKVLEFISLFLCITSFYLHFLVTGRVFQYIEKIKEKELGKHERKTKIKRTADSLRTDLCNDSRDDNRAGTD